MRIYPKEGIRSRTALKIYSIPNAIIIKPIILERALIPEAPRVLMMILDEISKRKVKKQTSKIDTSRINLS